MAASTSMHNERIWRTVVFAGAMLASPLGCGSKPPPAPAQPVAQPDKPADKAPDPTPPDTAAKPPDTKPSDDADQAAADKAAADQAAADKAAADDAAAKKKRPRGGNERPTGRGFVLA